MGRGALIAILVLSAALLAGVALWLNERRKLRLLTRQIEDFLSGKAAQPPLSLKEGDLAALANAVDQLMQSARSAQDYRAQESRENVRWLLDVSHQFKTPLASLRLFCEMDASAHQAEQLMLLSRMEQLLQGLLRLQKLRAGGFVLQFEPTELAPLIREAILPLEQAYPQVTIHLSGSASARCDRLWLSEAVSNVVKNACEQYAGEGRVDIALADTGLSATITVSDQAGGLPQEQLPMLFRRFYQARPSQGVGVGLAIVREILALHHGIAVAENAQDGLRIILTLPNLAHHLTRT